MNALTLHALAVVACIQGCAFPPEGESTVQPSVELAAIESLPRKEHGIALETRSEAPGTRCPFGGLRVDYGIDVNDDGALQVAEIDGTSYTCSTKCGSYTCGGSCGACNDGLSCEAGTCTNRDDTSSDASR